MAKRKKTLKLSKSTDDSLGVSPSVSPLRHIKRRVDDAVSTLCIDIPDIPDTASTATCTALSSDSDGNLTIESGVITTPMSLNDITQHFTSIVDGGGSITEPGHAKVILTRTISDGSSVLTQSTASIAGQSHLYSHIETGT